MTWLRHIDIKDYKTRFDLTDFVETGCWEGDGIDYAINCGYENIHSCDISKFFADACTEKFPQASIKHQESLAYLTELLPTLRQKTLFWLDAHFPSLYGTDDSTEEFRIPLITEIELIKQLKPDYANDVIVCDDMRTFKSDKNPRYKEGELQEHLLLDVDWDMFTNLLSDTHDINFINDYDGVIIFYPKNK